MKALHNRQIAIAVLISIILLGSQVMAQGGPGAGRGQGRVCPHCQQGGPQGPGGRGVQQMRGPQAQSEPRRPGPQGPGPMHIGHILRQLDLTEEQQDLAQEIFESKQEAVEAGHEVLAEAHQALRQAVIDEDTEAITSVAAALGQATGEQALLMVSITASVKEMLTEEQLQAWEEIKAQIAEQKEQGPGPGRDRGPRGRGRDQFGPQGPQGRGGQQGRGQRRGRGF